MMQWFIVIASIRCDGSLIYDQDVRIEVWASDLHHAYRKVRRDERFRHAYLRQE